jgi:hypothetical protein
MPPPYDIALNKRFSHHAVKTCRSPDRPSPAASTLRDMTARVDTEMFFDLHLTETVARSNRASGRVPVKRYRHRSFGITASPYRAALVLHSPFFVPNPSFALPDPPVASATLTTGVIYAI